MNERDWRQRAHHPATWGELTLCGRPAAGDAKYRPPVFATAPASVTCRRCLWVVSRGGAPVDLRAAFAQPWVLGHAN